MFRVYKYAKGYYLPMILSPLCIVVEGIIEVFVPYLMSTIINEGIGETVDIQDMDLIWKCGILMVIMAVISMICGFLSGVFATKASAGLAKNVRKALYDKVNEFSFANIDKFSTSSLVTRMTTDVNSVQMSFQMSIRILFRAPILFVTSIVLSFVKNWQIAIIFCILCPILLAFILLIMSKAHPYFRTMFKKYDRLNLVVQENINAIRTVKAFTTEEKEINKFEDASSEVKKYAMSAEKVVIFQQPISQLLMGAASIIIILFGGHMVVSQTFGMQYGDITMFIMYGQQILSSLIMVSMVLMMIVMSRAAIERIFEVLDTESDIKSPSASEELPNGAIKEVKDGSIEFNNVNFSYLKDMNKLALKDLNFKIESGETVGIFGGTGSGKSSLVSLIARLYDATTGEVLVGGVNVKNYDLVTLRDQVSMVLQKNVLFSGTVRSNLKWGNEFASDEELKEVLDLANASEFVFANPLGLDAHVEQGGVNFSGGQKQRLCIARALLKKPKILVLDDSTSAVDTATDARIREALKSYIPETTKLIIAQRVSSIMDADKIIFIHDGVVENIGTHEELLKLNKIYKEISESQLKGVK